MPRQHGNTIDPDFLMDGSAYLAQNFSRLRITSDLVAGLVTQIMTSVAIPLQAGDKVTNLSFLSGATAAGTPTNWWFALYDNSATPALLFQSADQLTAAWAADTVKTLALSTAVTIVVPGVYYAAIMVKATTVPTLVGVTIGRAAAAGAVLSGQKVLAQNSGAALTTTAPATIATPTTQAVVPWVAVS
jgi:hypothetical protein